MGYIGCNDRLLTYLPGLLVVVDYGLSLDEGDTYLRASIFHGSCVLGGPFGVTAADDSIVPQKSNMAGWEIP